MTRANHNRLNRIAGFVSVSVAAILVTAKLVAFWITDSLSVAASLADSGLDLLVSLIALTAIVYAARPPDDDHAFGHSSAEDLAALAQAAAIIASAGAIALASIRRLTDDTPAPLAAETAGIIVMSVSIALTLGLVLFQRRVARRTGSKVVEADSLHYVGDLIPNIGAIIALVASRQIGAHALDSVIALGAALLMTVGAFRIARRAVDALMDRKAPDEVEAGVASIAAAHPGVRGHHDLKTRTAGSQLFVSLHVELDGEQSLRAAHDIGATLRLEILKAYPNADVLIHKDVWRPDADGGA